MLNYTHEGLDKYVRGTEAEVIEKSSKNNFKAFEWESIKVNDIGLSTSVRMVSVQNGKIIREESVSVG